MGPIGIMMLIAIVAMVSFWIYADYFAICPCPNCGKRLGNTHFYDEFGLGSMYHCTKCKFGNFHYSDVKLTRQVLEEIRGTKIPRPF